MAAGTVTTVGFGTVGLDFGTSLTTSGGAIVKKPLMINRGESGTKIMFFMSREA